MTDLFIEICSEEIPARMQQKGASDFQALLTTALKKEGLSFDKAEVLVSPRRIALALDGLPRKTPGKRIERKGPRVDAPPQAIEGFLASTGLPLERCERRTLPKGEFLFATIEETGRTTADILPALIEQAIASIPWPHTMRWGAGEMAWIRPIHTLITLFGGDVLPVKLSVGGSEAGIQAGAITSGHRFMSPGTFPVSGVKDYVEKLERSYVMVNPQARREKILKEAQDLAFNAKLRLREDATLLEEVTGLVEWPVVLMGRIEERFMTLPPAVLSTVMKVHQRYFSVEDREGTLAPFFIFVANTEASDQGKTIIEGNERVLKARLSDAAFFWHQDRRTSLQSLLPRLKKMKFHEDLGSLYDKTTRLHTLAVALSESLAQTTPLDFTLQEAHEAAQLCKADLVTEMVYEFPELQGIMGGYYAAAEGLSSKVCEAIGEHYRPRGAHDTGPQSLLGAVVALADRLDTLVGFFAVGLRPTGSKDPFALRRAVLSLIRLQEDHIDLTFEDLMARSYALYAPLLQGCSKALSQEETFERLRTFYLERLKIYWKDQGVRPDILAAVLSVALSDPLRVIKKRLKTLASFLDRDTQGGRTLLSVYKRVRNILEAENFAVPADFSHVSVVPSKFCEAAEKELWAFLENNQPKVHALLACHDFEGALSLLTGLGSLLEAYFDHVTVNTQDADQRFNRLATLGALKVFLSQIADFSTIEDPIL